MKAGHGQLNFNGGALNHTARAPQMSRNYYACVCVCVHEIISTDSQRGAITTISRYLLSPPTV